MAPLRNEVNFDSRRTRRGRQYDSEEEPRPREIANSSSHRGAGTPLQSVSKDAGARQIWSAVTCHRFVRRRLEAVLRWPRQVATYKSGNELPHSKGVSLSPHESYPSTSRVAAAYL